MNTTNKFLITAIAGCAVTLSSHAFNGGWSYFQSKTSAPYAGLKVGQAKYDEDSNLAFSDLERAYGPEFASEFDIDIDDANLYGAYAGYTFDSGFGFEADFITTERADVVVTPPKIEGEPEGSAIKGDLKSNSLGLAATYKHRFTDSNNVYLKGKLGGVVHDQELRLWGDKISETNTDWTAAAGIGFDPSNNSSIELEYSRIDNGIDALTLSAQFRF